MLLWFIEKLLIGFLKAFSVSKALIVTGKKCGGGGGVLGKHAVGGRRSDCIMDDRFISCPLWGYALQSSSVPPWLLSLPF